ECLNGSRPFDADSPIATALAHIREDVPPLPDHVPPALDHVVRRAMAKNPAQRYPDGAALAEALREAGGSGAAVPPPPAETTQVLPAAGPAAVAAAAATPGTRETPVAAEPSAERVTTTRTSNRWPLYAAAVLALLVVVALLVAHPWTDDTSADGTTSDERVRVRANAYIGDPVEDVEAALADKGLETNRNEVSNPGDEKAGTVADLDPTGRVRKGTTITLDVWGEPPSDEGDEGDEGDKGDKGSDKKTEEPKPDKTKEPKPDENEVPVPPTDPSDGADTGGTGGLDTGSQDTGSEGAGALAPSEAAAPGGRATQQGEPSTGQKGD
ncbi:MAG: PASTA domain-containing protein, partial [Marmoricola sp.]